MKLKLNEIKEGLFIALKAIRSNKIRAILTTLGIVIGIWAVVLMSVALNGIDKAFNDGIGILGAENIYISKWEWGPSTTPWWEIRNRPNLTYKEYKQYEKLAKLPVSISPFAANRLTVKYKDHINESTFIYGTNNTYLKTSNVELGEGRFFSEIEHRAGRHVAVVGYNVADNIYSGPALLGSTIDIGGIKYKVIGFLKKQGTVMMGGLNPDNMVIVPIETLFKHFSNRRYNSINVNIKATSVEDIPNVEDEARSIFRKIRSLTYRDKDNFSINKQEAIQEMVDKIVLIIKLAGFAITGLALLVGAIGIMNIMFVSVKERTKEIGVRKAIGAKRSAILNQFLFESAVICLIGGAIGLGLAILSSFAVNQFLPTSIQPGIVIIAISISVLTGVISGLAPAYTAAKLDPVEALRYE